MTSRVWNPQMRRGESSADFCRRMGFEVGSHLIGDEGYGPTVIRLTAIGERSILAIEVPNGEGGGSFYESTWTLEMRDWRLVAGPQMYYGA